MLGLHRHVVRLVELGEPDGPRTSYVVKELPDHLAQREYRLLRGLVEDRLPTAIVVAVVTSAREGRDGLLITRHLDYSLPYRSLLSGRGLHIPYLGDKLLDSLVGLLVRLHLAGFFWGDCSLSNALFRRDAGELAAYIIDVETSERYEQLSDGQRRMDLDIATENVAGGLLDLQAGGRLVADVDPWAVAENLESRYAGLWREVTGDEVFNADELWRISERVQRLHDLGFDVGEIEVVTEEDGQRLRFIPRVVESGYHQDRLYALTGLWAGENQARRLLDDIREFRAELSNRTGRQGAGEHRRRALAGPALRAHHRRRCPPRCTASCRPPSCTTRSSSTAGSCRSARLATCRWRRRSAPTSATCSSPRRTSSCASIHRRARSPGDLVATSDRVTSASDPHGLDTMAELPIV